MPGARKRTMGVAAIVVLALLMPVAAFAAGQRFADVPVDAWYYDDVEWAAQNGIVNGRPDGTFDPDAPLTRADAAALMRRLAESGVVEASPDVASTYVRTDVLGMAICDDDDLAIGGHYVFPDGKKDIIELDYAGLYAHGGGSYPNSFRAGINGSVRPDFLPTAVVYCTPR